MAQWGSHEDGLIARAQKPQHCAECGYPSQDKHDCPGTPVQVPGTNVRVIPPVNPLRKEINDIEILLGRISGHVGVVGNTRDSFKKELALEAMRQYTLQLAGAVVALSDKIEKEKHA